MKAGTPGRALISAGPAMKILDKLDAERDAMKRDNAHVSHVVIDACFERAKDVILLANTSCVDWP